MMRYTIIDGHGTVSFRGPGHVLKALVAACSFGETDIGGLLDRARRYDQQFVDGVLNELAQFDEHVVPENAASIDRWLALSDDEQQETFRVVDQRLRNRSLASERLGVVLFNLPQRRIVQIQNAYGELLRKDRGRIRVEGKPVNRYYHYDLPAEWSILP